MSKQDYIFEARGISKRFPGVRALDHVDFKLRRGEVHAIIGENGAGKSTLMNVMLGQYIPDEGEMVFKGERYAPNTPGDALQKGISMIHQEISLIPTTSVSENIWIGREGIFGKGFFTNKKKQNMASRKILEQLGLDIDPDTEVSGLSVAMMQLVEVARAVSYDSDIIIMDEPTSSLTSEEVKTLYSIIRDMTAKNKSVIFISHKLDEVYAICDTVTVLRDGQFIDCKPAADTTREELVTLMVGRELNDMYPKEEVKIGSTVLEVRELSTEKGVHSVSFQVRRGEILGFSGLMGAGRTEIMQAVFGIDKKDSGQILIDGNEVTISGTTGAINHKLAMVTEDRRQTGMINGLSVKENIALAYMRSISKMGFVDAKKEVSDAEQMVKVLSIKTPSIDNEISVLSGGNQQKAIIAKWLLTKPEVLILDEPTRGIDVGAKAEIYRLIGSLAKEGKAIIVISSELPELMGICDRILVVREGRIVAEYTAEEFEQKKIMKSAFGVQ